MNMSKKNSLLSENGVDLIKQNVQMCGIQFYYITIKFDSMYKYHNSLYRICLGIYKIFFYKIILFKIENNMCLFQTR